MIGQIVMLLSTDDFYGVSDTVDIAKGINKIPMNFKEASKLVKRRRCKK